LILEIFFWSLTVQPAAVPAACDVGRASPAVGVSVAGVVWIMGSLGDNYKEKTFELHVSSSLFMKMG
jgi:hypothetical protein